MSLVIRRLQCKRLIGGCDGIAPRRLVPICPGHEGDSFVIRRFEARRFIELTNGFVWIPVLDQHRRILKPRVDIVGVDLYGSPISV